MNSLCGCGCGKVVTNEMMACFPVLPWDPPEAPARRKDDRCAYHNHCAYRDDDPTRCPRCHGRTNCTCTPAWKEPAYDPPPSAHRHRSGRCGPRCGANSATR